MSDPLFDCHDCKQNVLDLQEYCYMVHDSIWEGEARMRCGDDNVLCVACIEARIGRKLRPVDFPSDIPLNFYTNAQSLRLYYRMHV